jgi:hypothetical protein
MAAGMLPLTSLATAVIERTHHFASATGGRSGLVEIDVRVSCILQSPGIAVRIDIESAGIPSVFARKSKNLCIKVLYQFT